MAYKKFTKISTTIKKGKREASPVYTGGAKVRFIGLPVNPDGTIALSGKTLTFNGMFETGPQFVVLDYGGTPLEILTKGRSVPRVDNYLDPAPALLPVRNPELFEGISVIIPVSNVIESEDRVIDIYFESSNP